MAIRTFNSVGGFSVGEVPVSVISNTGNISNVANAVIGNVTVQNLSNTFVTFTNNGKLADSANLTFTTGNVLTIIDAANITSGDLLNPNYVSLTGSNGGITTTGNANLANGAFTINTDGDAAIANSLVVGYNTTNGDSAFYVDAAGNFAIKVANTLAPTGFTTVFSVDAESGDITTAGSVVNPEGGAATITAPGANTQILFNDSGNVGASSLFKFDTVAKALTVDNKIQLVNSASNANIYVDTNGAHLDQGTANIIVNGTTGVDISAGTSNVKVAASGNVSVGVGANDWTFTTTGNLSAPGGIYANTGEVKSSTLTVTSTANLLGLVTIGNTNPAGTSANLDVSGNLHVYQDANIDGGLTIANLNVTNFVTSNLIPSEPEVFDLGSEEFPWRDLWLSGSSIKLGGTTLTSTAGNIFTTAKANIFTSLDTGTVTTTGFANIGNIANTADLFVSGVTSIGNGTVNASSTTTGALKVNGGVGVTGNIYIGGIANVVGDLKVGTDLTTGAANANVTGSIDIGKDANVGGNLVVTGNLTVSGTTTYVNTINSSIKDALISIGGSDNGNLTTGPDTYDRGLLIRNWDTGVNNQFMGWKQSASEFQLKTGVLDTLESNTLSGGSYANVRVDHLFGTIGTVIQDEIENLGGLITIDVTDYANVTGTANINFAILADLTLGELHFTNLDVTAPADNEVVVLRTDGLGEVTFEVIHTDRISNGTSNVFVTASGNVNTTVDGVTSLIVTDSGANVTGTFNVTGELTAGSLSVGSLSPESITIGNTKIDDATTTVNSGAGATVIAEVTAEIGTAVEFFVKGKSTSGTVNYMTVATITAMYGGDGANVDFATYGKLHLGGETGAGALSVSYDDEAGNMQLLATPSQSTTTVWTAQIRTI